ncbi:MAG: CotH kinase family protein [Lachnospiraceae bacterium]|nr:CotH kinase family protein [Lachnospiraceae bacterium]
MSNKSLTAVKLFLIFIIAVVLAVFASLDIKRRGTDETDYMYATLEGRKINILRSQDKYYLFLPSFAEEADISYSKEAKKHDITVLRSENIPAVFISTNSGSIDSILEDKNNTESGKISVIDENGNTLAKTGLKSLKGRGNYSWSNWEKKPFGIKLKKEISVPGLGTGDEFALLANASDGTLIRNDIARELETKVGVKYAGKGLFADLYINGDYMGNYYICRNISIGVNDIDIKDMEEQKKSLLGKSNPDALKVYETPVIKGWNIPDADDISGGYLVEREFKERYALEYGEIKSGFITPGNEHFVVKSPGYCSVEEIKYISGCFEEAEGALLSKDLVNPFTQKGVEEYIDIDSFAKRYLIEETLKNYDGGVSSLFYYKDSDTVDGRIFAGPGWDFDMSLGNYLDWMSFSLENGEGLALMNSTEGVTVWYINLLKDKEFLDLVKKDYVGAVVPYYEWLLSSGLDEYERKLSPSLKMDRIRWNGMYQDDPERSYDLLRQFITERKAFLDGEWTG